MSQKTLHAIHQEVKEKSLAKQRMAWFNEYKKVKNVRKVCTFFGISRSQFYYWKKRLDIASSGKGKGYAKHIQLLSYSRKPHTHPSMYSPETVELIVKIRKKTKRGAEVICFLLKDKYALHLSVSGIYKVLKREGLIKERRKQRKKSATYNAPTYLPGDKVQIDVKYVKLVDEVAKKRGKQYRFVYQYTALDVATGIKCKLIYEDHSQNASMDFLSRVRHFYPFPLKIIQTDNGHEFTFRLCPHIKKVHPFTQQCELFGYEHHIIPPAYPRANSHVERTHRTDEEEVYRGKTFTSLRELHNVNLKTVKYFNEKRPQQTKHFFAPKKYAIIKFRLHTCYLNYTVLNVCN
jgi:hypothetical protein